MPAQPKPDNRDSAPPKKRRSGQRLTADEKRRAQAVFLDAFAQSANVTAACRKAGIDRATMYRWQEHDEAFSLRYKQAEAEANDVIRGAIFQRAIIGVDKPLHYQGRLVKDEHGQRLTVKEYSDTLLIFLAKSRMPEFREKSSVDLHASIDIQGAADEADRRWAALLAAGTAGSILDRTERESES